MKERWHLRRAQTLKKNDVIWDPLNKEQILVTHITTQSDYVGYLAEITVRLNGLRSDNVNFTEVHVQGDRYFIVRLSDTLIEHNVMHASVWLPPELPTPPARRFEFEKDPFDLSRFWRSIKGWLNGC